MTRSRYRVLLAAAACLARSPAPAAAQDSLSVYLPVLEQLRERYANRPVLLYSTRLRVECGRGGCSDPYAGALPPEWLSSVRGRGLVAGWCRFDRGLCLGADGRSMYRSDGAYLMLGTLRTCGEGCVETLTSVTADEETGTIRRTTLYRLIREDGRWCVGSATLLEYAVID